jgi:hypothetical protein
LAGESAVYVDTLDARLGGAAAEGHRDGHVVTGRDVRGPGLDLPGRRSTKTSLQRRPTSGASLIRDISDLKVPEDKSAGRFAAESWNMKGSRLELHDLVFGGW